MPFVIIGDMNAVILIRSTIYVCIYVQYNLLIRVPVERTYAGAWLDNMS